MKQLYTTQEYKFRNTKKIANSYKSKRNKKYSSSKFKNKFKRPRNFIITVYAPSDFRTIDNPDECLLCFRQMRDLENINKIARKSFIEFSMEFITEIDYATISILTSISDDLKFKKINVRGTFPKNPRCLKLLIESGFLAHIVGKNNRKFPKSAVSDLIFFEKGIGVLTAKENKKISELIKNVMNHLTGVHKYCLPIKTIILEICGNSIEWSGTQNRQWLLGVQYDSEKVTFTVTDVGKGILSTLHRKFGLILKDAFMGKSDSAILAGAFDQKYGSSTQEENRNKGLPAVKTRFQDGSIKSLKVLSNNVILDFENNERTKTFQKGSPRFKGTFYQWEMTKDCIHNLNAV